MTEPAPQPSPSASLIGSRIPIPQKIMIGLAGLLFLAMSLSAMFQTGQPDAAAVFLALCLGTVSYLYGSARAYRIAWDDERVYMRIAGGHGLLFLRQPFRSIAYDEIAAVEGRTESRRAPPPSLLPFDHLEIAARDPEKKPILIHPEFLDTADMARFLLHLHRKRPGILPPAIQRLMPEAGPGGA